MVLNDITKKKPIATETGCWDGKRCTDLLVKTRNGKYHIATMYEGFIDGSQFCDFYDDRDFKIKNVIAWVELP